MVERQNQLATATIHRALSRPTLLMGADRELVLVTGLVTVILVFVILTVGSALLGALTWTVVVSLLRMMARADPAMRRIYLKHIQYRPSYRPTSTPWRA